VSVTMTYVGLDVHARSVHPAAIDVLTGDWLAELTMYILHKTRQRSGGYARTFLRELEDVLPTCIERGITVVANAGGLDPEGLSATIRAHNGVARLSRERVRAELMKLLAAPHASEVVQTMGECGFFEPILGGVAYTKRLSRLIAIEAERRLGGVALLRLAALGVAIPEDADRLRGRLRLANTEADRLKSAAAALIGLHGITSPPSFHGLRALLFKAGREAARDALALAQAESDAPPSDAVFATANRFLADAPEPKLPISGADLIARGVAAGQPVGRALRAFQALWIRASFPKEPETLTRLLEEAVAESARAEAPTPEAEIDRRA